MIIACSTLGLADIEVREACDAAEKWGFRYLDIALCEGMGVLAPSALAEDHATGHIALAHAMAAAGLTAAAFHVDSTGAELATEQEQIAGACRLAAACGVDLITIQPRPGDSMERERQRVRALLAVTRIRNTVLAIETDERGVTGTPENCLRLLEAAPDLAVAVHVHMSDAPSFTEEGWRAVLPYVRLVRLHLDSDDDEAVLRQNLYRLMDELGNWVHDDQHGGAVSFVPGDHSLGAMCGALLRALTDEGVSAG